MKKILKLIKNNLVAFILSAILFSCIGIYAATNTTLLSSSIVTYDNTTSGSSATTVEGALTDLYGIANTLQASSGNCINGYVKISTVNGYSCYQTAPIITDNGDGILSEGDMVTYALENFYIAELDNSSIKLLPQFNLSILDDPIVQTETADTKAFSSTKYWSGWGYVYNENSNLYPYIEKYKQKLIDLGVPVTGARVLTYDEIVKVQNYSWAKNQQYWGGTYVSCSLGSGTECLWIMNNYGPTKMTYHSFNGGGIRPLIIVPRDSIQI